MARATYGIYLQELLAAAQEAAPDRLRVVKGEAVDLVGDDGATVLLSDGTSVAADAVVLAVGNLPPHIPPGLEDVARSSAYFGNPWDPGATRGLDDRPVLLMGSGLTMVDVALMLRAQGFEGQILALSRRGLLPHRHAPVGQNISPLAERPRGALSTLVRTVRRRGNAIGWRAAVDGLRPFTQGMWANAHPDERRRFLRHLRPWWDVHRHRLAPPVADRISALVANGALRVLAGRTCSATETPDGVDVQWRPRGADMVETMMVQRVICCTGPQGDLTRTKEPLLASLAGRGRISADAEKLGIDVDAADHVLDGKGVADDRLFAVGPMTRGAFWEIVAVPDIRRQVWDLARALSNAQWVAGEGL